MTDYSHTLTNPGAEAGDISGWTQELGSNLAVRTASPAPHSGSYYFYSSNDTEFKYYQQVDLVTDGVPTGTIDSGGIWFWVTWWQSSYGNSDQGEIIIRALNSSQVEIESFASGLLAAPEDVWNQYDFAPILPANTRYVDIIMHGFRGAGTACDSYFDDISAKSTDVNTTEMQLTQNVVEVLRSGDVSNVQLTQNVVEVLRSGDVSNVQLTQNVIEVLRSSNHIANYTFKDNPSDQAPPGITKKTGASGDLVVVDETGVVDSKIVEEDGTIDSTWKFYALDDYPDVTDVEVLAKVKIDKNIYTQSSPYSYIAIKLRGIDSPLEGYAVHIEYDGDDEKFQLQLGYWDNGSWTDLGSAYLLTDNGLNIALDKWFYIRMYLNGTDVKAKAWGKVDTEPTDWQIEQVDSTITAGGYIAWGWRNPLYSTNLKHKVDFVDIILDGISEPPVPLEGNPAVVVTKTSADVLAEDDSALTVQVAKSTVEVLAEVPKDYVPKVDSNVIVL